ncbi:MAG: LysM peptidoglycan-binding domain-containing protein [Bacilli bacterium]|nr:LysM peptidoglycan-binding domain-containing protein [Bacilli bacterium]
MKKLVPFTKEIEFKTMISKVTSISLEHTLRVEKDNLISGYFILEGTYKMTQASQIDEEFSYKIPVDIELDEKYDTSNITLDIDDFTYEVIDEEKMRLNITLCIDNIEEKEVVLPVEDVIEDFDALELEDKNSGNRESKNDEVLDDLFLDTSKKVPLEFDSKKEIVEEESEQNNNDNTTINNAESVETSNELIYENNTSNNNTNNDTNKPQMVNNNVSSIFSSFKDNIETYKTYSVYIMKEEDTIDVVLQKYGVTREELEEYNDMSDIKTGSKIIVPSSSKNE